MFSAVFFVHDPLWQVNIAARKKSSQVKACVRVLDVVIADGHAILYRYVQPLIPEAVHIMVVECTSSTGFGVRRVTHVSSWQRYAFSAIFLIVLPAGMAFVF